MEPLEDRTLLSVTILGEQFKAMDFTGTGTFSGTADLNDTGLLVSYSGTLDPVGTLHYDSPTHAFGSGTGTGAGSYGFGEFGGSISFTGYAGQPMLLVDDVSVGGETDAVFQVLLTESLPAGQSVTVDYATENGTATAGSNYQAVNGTLTFLPGETLHTVRVPVSGAGGGANEQFLLRLANAQGAAIRDEVGVGTIIHSGGTSSGELPAISVFDSGAQEYGMLGSFSFAEFVLALSSPSSEPVTVNFTTSPGTALSGVDYQPVQWTVTFAPGETWQYIAVPVLDDSATELHESFYVNLWNPVNAVIDKGTAACVITDNDNPPPSILTTWVDDAVVLEGDDGATLAVFNVRLAEPSEDEVVVMCSTSDGTAHGDVDYTPWNMPLIFPPGEIMMSVAIFVYSNETPQRNRTFFLNTATDSGLGVILDDDTSPALAGGAALEGDSGTRDLTLTIPLAAAAAGGSAYSTEDGTAVAGVDYQATSGILTFEPGQTEAHIVVHLLGNTVPEPDKQFFVRLSNEMLFVGTIMDDDGAFVDDDGQLSGFGFAKTFTSDPFQVAPYVPGLAGPHAATGTLDTSSVPFAVTVQWDSAFPDGRAVGTWEGTISPQAAEPFDTRPVDASWTSQGVQFAFETIGPVQPTANRSTPIAVVRVYWSGGPSASAILAPASNEKVPIYWNQARGSAEISGLTQAPVGTTHLLVITDAELRVSESNEDNNVLALSFENWVPWRNAARPLDVNDDTDVTPLDALLVINELNRVGSYKLEPPSDDLGPPPYYDVNGDHYVSPIDALLVINDLNRGDGEGEADDTATSAIAATTWWTVAANTEMYEVEASNLSAEKRAVDSRADNSRPSTLFLQSLDLLYATLDEAKGTKTWEPCLSRRGTLADDLEEFLESMLNGMADEEEL